MKLRIIPEYEPTVENGFYYFSITKDCDVSVLVTDKDGGQGVWKRLILTEPNYQLSSDEAKNYD